MDAQRALLTVPVARPLTDPITRAAASRHRRCSGHCGATREATVWGTTPDILTPRGALARSFR